MTALFEPGEAAERTGLTLDTLRYYERQRRTEAAPRVLDDKIAYYSARSATGSGGSAP